MCGIAGFVDFAGHAPGEAQRAHRAHDRRIAHRGPDGDGDLRRRARGARPSPPGHHRPGLGAAAHGRGRRPGADRLQRRDLQLPGVARRSWRRAATSSARAPTPRPSLRGLPGVGRGRASNASMACSRSRSGMRAHSRCCWRRDRVGKKPLYLLPPTARSSPSPRSSRRCAPAGDARTTSIPKRSTAISPSATSRRRRLSTAE